MTLPCSIGFGISSHSQSAASAVMERLNGEILSVQQHGPLQSRPLSSNEAPRDHGSTLIKKNLRLRNEAPPMLHMKALNRPLRNSAFENLQGLVRLAGGQWA